MIDPAQSGKQIKLTDNRGRTAVIGGCEVVLDDGSLHLRLTAEEPSQSLVGEIVGRVVDREGRSVRGAAVTCWHPLLFSPDTCKSDEHGGFRFRGYFKWSPEKQKPAFRLTVLKNGYVGADFVHDNQTEIIEVNPDGVHQLTSPIVLAQGYGARLRILGADREPVEGAWVEPNGAYSLRAQFAKSNEHGNCMVRNLPEGVTRLDVNWGDQSASADVVVNATSADEEPVTIRLSKQTETAQKEPPTPTVVKPGENAPEWSISDWTDGKVHKLSDFRGKVVLVDFWGVWCDGCVKAIPAVRKVQEKFGDRIVLVGIHTPGTEISQIKKLLGLKDWNVPVGLDNGPALAKGETAVRYGVYGYPTFIIIDKQGRIAFNPEAVEGAHDKDKVMAKAEALAKEAGVPWPIDKDVSEDEARSRIERIQVYMLSKEVEKALATK